MEYLNMDISAIKEQIISEIKQPASLLNYKNIIIDLCADREQEFADMLDKRRIYDRILEMCTPMYVGGASKREAIASMKMEKAKTLLNTNRGEEEYE